MATTISAIEDTLISTIAALKDDDDSLLFREVISSGRKARPASLSYPSAFVYFVKDEDTGARPRPVRWLTYEVLVVAKNVSSEGAAAKSIYTLIDAVDAAINFKQLGYTDIEPFTCTSRELAEYESGVIAYALQFKTRFYMAVPT